MSLSHQNCCFHTTLTAAFNMTPTKLFEVCGAVMFHIMSDACSFTVFITQVVMNSDGCVQSDLGINLLEKEVLQSAGGGMFAHIS